LRVKAGCETLQIALHIAPKPAILGWKFQKIFWRGGIASCPDIWREGHLLPIPYPCGASILAPLALSVPALIFFTN